MRLIDADELHAGMVESYMLLRKQYEDAQDEQTINYIAGQLVIFAELMMRVKYAPTIGAEPVRHGRWEEVKVKNFYDCMITAYECTNCKKHSVGQVAITMKSDYCPNCGAMMRGDTDE